MEEQSRNPYSAPRASLDMEPDAAPRGPRAEGACPRCGAADLTRPSFTWWGGAIGPKLLHHTVCRGCGFGFHAKTGKSNGGAITAYVIASFALALVLVFLLGR